MAQQDQQQQLTPPLDEEKLNEEDVEDMEDLDELKLLCCMMSNEHKMFWDNRFDLERKKLMRAAQIKQQQQLQLKSEEEGTENNNKNKKTEEIDPLETLFVWFGRLSLVSIVSQIVGGSLLSSDASHDENCGLSPDTSHVLDLGTGNGLWCETMAAVGFRNVWGVDYSEKAIELCLEVQKQNANQRISQEGEEASVPPAAVNYQVDDILHTKLEKNFFDLIHDCGTLDSIAMTLAEDGSDREEELGARYFEQVIPLLKPKGLLVIRSCNHDVDEMNALLSAAGNGCGKEMTLLVSDDDWLGTELHLAVWRKREE